MVIRAVRSVEYIVPWRDKEQALAMTVMKRAGLSDRILRQCAPWLRRVMRGFGKGRGGVG
jgi:hypothetical protein